MKVWQLNSGPLGGSRIDMMLRYQVALVGPGETGAWSLEAARNLRFPTHVQRFAREAAQGDAILLRVGKSRVRAAGLVVGDYEYLPQFEDVDGFDVAHARRVRWYAFATDQEAQHGVPGGASVAFSDTRGKALIDLAKSALGADVRLWQPASLPPLPADEPTVEHPEDPVRLVAAEAQDLWLLYATRSDFGEPPAEGELVAHLVVPLLRALGWRPEQMAIEWRRVDVALFPALPRTPNNLHVLIEVKRIRGIDESALKQARRYLRELGVERDVVVTDGFTYRRYAAAQDYAPTGYANLVRLKEHGVRLLDELSPSSSRTGGR